MQATIQYIKKELAGLYPESETHGFIRLILGAVCGLNYTDLILQKNKIIDDSKVAGIKNIVERLKSFEPIQYILGETEFCDLCLQVNPSVLIPRPETEELVDWIVKSEIKNSAAILDIGTGSGCIPLSIKRKLADAQVFGIDISEQAVQVATKNAALNNLDVEFFQADILNWKKNEWDKYDVIVSNPPYVRESEKKLMQPNVLDYEPETALFVSDTDPLIFYRTIAEFAHVNLTENGWLFFEINENMGREMRKLLQDSGFHSVDIKKDINGKDRMSVCRK
ncbi:MAG: peptide chain release factor N(5)-glutamine methyltransferase [Bacteroidota bacterium]